MYSEEEGVNVEGGLMEKKREIETGEEEGEGEGGEGGEAQGMAHQPRPSGHLPFALRTASLTGG